MQILVINSGSSSIKFQLIHMPSAEVACKGLVERIGTPNTKVHWTIKGQSVSETVHLSNHEDGLHHITKILKNPENKLISHPEDIKAVVHRVVHGGNTFNKPTIIDAVVLSEIERLSALAPLHNPANAKGIKVASDIFPKAVQIAIFDTAFHTTLPEKAYTYAIPKTLSEQHHIRVYGFHGTSHEYVSKVAMDHLKLKHGKLISIHLGNGCSITAIKAGKSIDHSLGFGPSNGLIMGTRSGDIDQSVLFYLMDTLGLPSPDVQNMIQKQSGLLGITGYSDLRDIQAKAEEGNLDCQLALEMTAYRIKKYIGAYVAAMNGVDALIFTAGIGENSSLLRAMVCTDMDALGLKIDLKKNKGRTANVLEIDHDLSKVKILVIPTNEELEMAQQSYALLKG
ncbi:acetate/propionate family kinase [Spongiimicrobium sp. 3-5]|uniref:acetate/propionate family kinase n=1 Tax=Spongiimicrobium sp. 3-5 TaxID=3332596 RepID=UPI00397E97C5